MIGELKEGYMGGSIARVLVTLSFCGTLLAAGGAVTDAEVYSWLSVWQRREGLEQWKIRLRIVHRSELPRGTIGHVSWSAGAYGGPGAAEIRVLYPSEMASLYRLPPRRWTEHAVVHELMHLVLAPLVEWIPPGAERSRVDDVVETLTKILVERRVPGGVSEAEFIDAQVSRAWWNGTPEVKKQVVLRLVRAMNAASEDNAIGVF